MCRAPKMPAQNTAIQTPPAPPPPPEPIAETVTTPAEDRRKNQSAKAQAGRTGLTIQRSASVATGGSGVQV